MSYEKDDNNQLGRANHYATISIMHTHTSEINVKDE